jgi:hypothetical protein
VAVSFRSAAKISTGVQWPQSACRRRLLDTDSSHGDKPKELELRGPLKNEGRRRFQKPLRPLSLRAFASLCIALSLAKQGLAYFSPPQYEAVHTNAQQIGLQATVNYVARVPLSPRNRGALGPGWATVNPGPGSALPSTAQVPP